MNRGATADQELTPTPDVLEAAQPWHQLSVGAVLDALKSSPQGLGAEEVQRRSTAVGPNELTAGKRRNPLRMFIDQFTDFMILVLLVAAVISGVIGEAKDTIAIVVIVALTLVLQMAMIYVPALNSIFKTAPLSLAEVAATLAIAAVVFVAVEIEKWVKRTF